MSRTGCCLYTQSASPGGPAHLLAQRRVRSLVLARTLRGKSQPGLPQWHLERTAVADHVHPEVHIVKAGATTKPREDCRLSRYGWYRTVQNADPAQLVVALGQTSFAVQTRRQKLADQVAAVPEEQRRLVYRSEMAILHQQLNEAARVAGVVKPEHCSTLTDHG